jgi:hypothetical protein
MRWNNMAVAAKKSVRGKEKWKGESLCGGAIKAEKVQTNWRAFPAELTLLIRHYLQC